MTSKRTGPHDDDARKEQQVTITVPEVSGAEVDEATDLVMQVVQKYGISDTDADALFNGMIAMFVRQRMVYGDRRPSVCSSWACKAAGEETN